ncbi:hypothetical protein EVAR_65105_1 [Eumeta japonica]|uniref:Uncharacterized protein n=1 Tax=Eumeta variegata TaxID=151549 RepID=A0A4C1ZQT7_EUMVA|nr:hypothetical protein EVAR_65105_1 [Eumeta japonica]
MRMRNVARALAGGSGLAPANEAITERFTNINESRIRRRKEEDETSFDKKRASDCRHTHTRAQRDRPHPTPRRPTRPRKGA